MRRLVFRAGMAQSCKVAGVKPGLELLLFLNLLLGSVSVTWHIVGEMERKQLHRHIKKP